MDEKAFMWGRNDVDVKVNVFDWGRDGVDLKGRVEGRGI